MLYLLGVTLLWAFSFSLIGVYLAGQVDAFCGIKPGGVSFVSLSAKCATLSWQQRSTLKLALLTGVQLA
ncbi:hypothetical protein ALON55S_04880 [Alishewanella longhuensis]